MAKEIVVTLANGDKAGETLKQLTHQAAALKKEISNLKPGTEEFVKASASLNQVKDRMTDIDKQVKSTTSASDALKKAWNTLPGASFFNQIGDSFSLAKQGVGGLTSGFGLLQKAIISTGIGALVVALGLVFNWMSKLESVTNVISGLFDGLSATVEVLGKAIAKLDFSNLGDNMVKAATEAYNLVQAFDALEDKQRGISILQAQSEKDVDQLLLKAKNVELSFAQRLELLNQAAVKERENYKDRLRYAAEYLLTVNREVKLAELKGEVDDKLADKRTAAIKDFIAVQRESIQIQEKIENRSAALREKMEADAAKRKEDERKRKEKEEKELQQQDDAIFIGMQEALDKEFKQLEDHRNTLKALDEKTKDEQAARDKQAFDKAKKLREQEMQEERDKSEFEKQLAAFKLETQRLAIGGIGDLIAQNLKDEQAARAAKKAFGVVDIGIRLSQELSANALAAATNPLNGITFGGAGAAQLAATNTRSIIMAAINTAKVLSFDKGGYTGPGGKYVPRGIVHAGEVVWSQEDVAQFGGVRAVEAVRPTSPLRGYYTGGPVSPFSNNTGRAPMPSGNAGSGTGNAMFDYDQMADAFDKRMDNKIKLIKTQVVVTELESAMKTVASIRDEANV